MVKELCYIFFEKKNICDIYTTIEKALGGGENFLRSPHIYTPPPRKEQNYEIGIKYNKD